MSNTPSVVGGYTFESKQPNHMQLQGSCMSKDDTLKLCKQGPGNQKLKATRTLAYLPEGFARRGGEKTQTTTRLNMLIVYFIFCPPLPLEEPSAKLQMLREALKKGFDQRFL